MHLMPFLYINFKSEFHREQGTKENISSDLVLMLEKTVNTSSLGKKLSFTKILKALSLHLYEKEELYKNIIYQLIFPRNFKSFSLSIFCLLEILGEILINKNRRIYLLITLIDLLLEILIP